MSNFFAMSRGDLCFIVTLLTFSFVSFLPWSRNMQWGGMAMLGWMMALLMLLSPTIAMLRLVAKRSEADGTSREVET